MYHFRTGPYPSPLDDQRQDHSQTNQSQLRQEPQYASSPSRSQRAGPNGRQDSARGMVSRPHNAGPTMISGSISEAPAFTRSKTDVSDEALELGRTWTGGLLTRKRSSDKRNQASRARAKELSDRYELSEVKKSDLNKKKGVFITSSSSAGSSSLGGNMMTMNQAMANIYVAEKKDKERKEKQGDPLELNDEIRARNRKQILKRTSSSERRSRKYQRSPPRTPDISPASSYGSDQDSVEVVAIGSMSATTSASIVPPTLATVQYMKPSNNLSSSPSKGGYRASNGVVYHLPNLC